MSDENEIARFEEQLDMPLPGRERQSMTAAGDEMDAFRSIFGGG